MDAAQKHLRSTEDRWIAQGGYSAKKGKPSVSDEVARGPVDAARKELEAAQAAYSTLEGEALHAGFPPASR